MSKIFKYPIDTDLVSLTVGYRPVRILSVQLQHGKPTAWIEVDEDYPGHYEVPFETVVTGATVPRKTKYEYITTLLYNDGSFVLHFYFDRQIVR